MFLSSLICLLGVGILSINLSADISFQAGDLWSFAGAFFFACQIVGTGVFAKEMDFRILVFVQFVAAAMLSLVIMGISGESFLVYGSPKGVLSVVYLGIFSTSLCYFLQTAAQQHVSSAKASIYLSTEALFGTLFAVALGYNQPNKTMIAGGVLILLAVILPEIGQIVAKSNPTKKTIKSGIGNTQKKEYDFEKTT